MNQPLIPADQSLSVLMTADEAAACAQRIRAGIENVRSDVLRLHDYEGWKALGYQSWRECVTAEFGQSERRLYQLLTAARIERELSTTVETDGCTIVQKPAPIPESHLRELARLPTPDARREVAQRVHEEHGEHATAANIREAVRLWTNEPTVGDLGDDIPPPPYIPPAERLMDEMTGVVIRALKTPIEQAVEGIGDGQLRDTELLARFTHWIHDLADALAGDGKIRRIR